MTGDETQSAAQQSGAPDYPSISVGPFDTGTDMWEGLPAGAVVERIGLIPDGARPGVPTVAIVIRLPDGSALLAQTSVRLFSPAVRTVLSSPGVADEFNAYQRRTARLARILADLDRCPHGRHEGDTCAGWDPQRPGAGCQGGYSLGNPALRGGEPIGTTLYGQTIWMPARGERHNPDAWAAGSVGPPVPVGPGLDDQTAALLLDERPTMINFWRLIGMSWHLRGNAVQVWSGGALVGVQALTEQGRPTGPYITVINELTDEQIAERDRHD